MRVLREDSTGERTHRGTDKIQDHLRDPQYDRSSLNYIYL